MFKFIFSLLLLDVVALTAMGFVSPLTPREVVRKSQGTPVDVPQMECGEADIIRHLLRAVKIALVLCSGFLAYRTRNVDVRFAEGTSMMFATCIGAVLFVSGLLTLMLAKRAAQRSFISGMISTVAVILATVVLFVPKMSRLDHDADDLSIASPPQRSDGHTSSSSRHHIRQGRVFRIAPAPGSSESRVSSEERRKRRSSFEASTTKSEESFGLRVSYMRLSVPNAVHPFPEVPRGSTKRIQLPPISTKSLKVTSLSQVASASRSATLVTKAKGLVPASQSKPTATYDARVPEQEENSEFAP
eukprot:scaffold106_cov246-Pinguiococcus_pyrenoidosus.AAC.1